MKHFSLLLIIITLFGCSTSEKDTVSAEQLLQNTINASSSTKDFFNTTIKFNIDELNYSFYRKNNITNFEVTRQLDTTNYKATYENGYISYFVNNVLQPQTSHSVVFIRAKLEVIAHLVSIPYVFKQNYVKLKKLNNVEIDDVDYHQLHISFKDVGDEPSKDEFILYINPSTYDVDYITEYHNLSRNKILFRKAINKRVINGIKVSDYEVYNRNKIKEVSVLNIYKYFEDGKLKQQDGVVFKNVDITFNN